MLAVAIVCTAVLNAPAADAQLSGQEPVPLMGRPVTTITVDAPDALDHDEIRATLDLRPGDSLDARALRRAVKRLYLVGQLADVQVWARPEGDGVAVRLVLVPALVVADVAVDGASQVDSDAIRDAVGVRVGDRLEGLSTEALSAAVGALYARRGFPQARVSVSTEAAPNTTQAVLRITVDEGPPTLVRAASVDSDRLRARRELIDRANLRAGQIFDAQRLSEALQSWRRRARARGHLEARHASPEVLSAPQAVVDVRVTLRHGPLYVLAFRGVRSVPVSTLREQVRFDPDEDFGPDTLARLEGATAAVLRRSGFPSARVRAGIGPGPRPGTRRVLLLVDEGPRSTLRKIEVRGAAELSPDALIQEAQRAVVNRYEDTTALSYVDPGDVRELLGRPPGRPRPIGGVEYPMSALANVDPAKVYDEVGYREATLEMEALYETNGFLSARVRGPQARWLNDAREVEATFEVEEGVRTLISSMRFKGNLSIASVELLEAADFAPGDPLDLAAVEEARLKLLEHYANNGFAFARVFEEVAYSADRTLANLSYMVDEGPAVTIGRIVVQGQDRTATAVILDRLVVREGDAFSKSRIEESRQRVLGLGLFTSVQLALVDANLPEPTKDLLVDVHETTARAFELNLGASVEDGPRASFLVEHRNVLGLGLGARSRIKVNYPRLTYFTIADPDARQDLEQRFDAEFPSLDPALRATLFTEGQALLTVEYPKMFGIPIDTSGHSSLVLLRENRSSFTLNKVGLLAGVDLRPISSLTLGSAVELEGTDFLCYAGVEGRYRTCLRDEAGLTRRQDNGQLGQVTLRQEAIFDRRDNPFRPHAGYRLSAVADLAFGSGFLYGEEARGPSRAITTPVYSNFLKLSSSASGYLPLTSTVTLALQGRVGNIFSLGNVFALQAVEHVPLYKKFFLGGTGSVRGFDEDRVIPADIASTGEGASPGGRFFWNLRSELRFPAWREVDLGLFLDAGELVESIETIDISQFSAGAGVGARWNTPVGPIALDVGFALKDPVLEEREAQRAPGQLFDFENRTKLHISIGYF